MLISRNKENIIEFNNLNLGDVFAPYNNPNTFYMRIEPLTLITLESNQIMNAICLESGTAIRFSPDVKIIPCFDAELVI